MITFEDFKKLDIRIGKIVFAEKVAGPINCYGWRLTSA